MPRGTGIAKRGFGRALTDSSRARFADGGDVNETPEPAEELESLPEPAEELEFLKEEKAEYKEEKSKNKTALDKVSEKIKKHIKDNVKFVTPSPKFKKGGKVEKVMHEFKSGKLHSGSKKGPVVKSRKQAIAIALSEAKKAKK
jgi:hypothetical protein